LVPSGSPLPPFDVQAPLLSLPGVLHTELATIPANVPYVYADGTLLRHWRQRLALHFAPRGSQFLIGIAWQGDLANPAQRLRSIRLTQFAALAQVPGVRLISLQKGPGTEQLERMKDEGGRMKHEEVTGFSSSFSFQPSSFVLDEASGAFMDTAAIMMHLDLVITSDTAVAHLAGALGVPVWLAVPMVPDWRWLLGREDSPWYPTMRLFRQRQQGQWEGVFQDIAGELTKLIVARDQPTGLQSI
jgi:hypothetical protein